MGLTAVVLPVASIVVIAGVAVIGGVLAALRPGWRAAHLDVLRAIASESGTDRTAAFQPGQLP